MLYVILKTFTSLKIIYANLSANLLAMLGGGGGRGEGGEIGFDFNGCSKNQIFAGSWKPFLACS